MTPLPISPIQSHNPTPRLLVTSSLTYDYVLSFPVFHDHDSCTKPCSGILKNILYLGMSAVFLMIMDYGLWLLPGLWVLRNNPREEKFHSVRSGLCAVNTAYCWPRQPAYFQGYLPLTRQTLDQVLVGYWFLMQGLKCGHTEIYRVAMKLYSKAKPWYKPERNRLARMLATT